MSLHNKSLSIGQFSHRLKMFIKPTPFTKNAQKQSYVTQTACEHFNNPNRGRKDQKN